MQTTAFVILLDCAKQLPAEAHLLAAARLQLQASKKCVQHNPAGLEHIVVLCAGMQLQQGLNEYGRPLVTGALALSAADIVLQGHLQQAQVGQLYVYRGAQQAC